MATKCLLGENTQQTDHCEAAWIIVILFNVIGTIYCYAGVALTKHGSANLSFFAGALLVPLSDFFFASSLVMGSDATDFTVFDVIGVIGILIGLAMYGFGANKQQEQQQLLKEAPFETEVEMDKVHSENKRQSDTLENQVTN